MFDRKTIFDQLQDMGAPRDSIVLIHSSLRAVGEVEGRGEGLLDILIEYFTAEGGLLCIPTHTWGNLSKPEKITLDLMEPETCIGTLPNIAARDPRAHRSLNTTHSLAVFGDAEKAEAFIAGELEQDSPLSPCGCHGKLYDADGYVMLVGVGHNRNTFLHCVEEMLDVPNRLSERVRDVSIRYPDGRVEKLLARSHRAEGIGDVSARYPKYEPAFRHYGCIADGKIGNAPTQLCRARKMKDVVELIRKRSGGAELLQDYEPLDPALYL
jgi:aminoglycoside 3-N-acetyltransferase